MNFLNFCEELIKNNKRWKFYANSPQTALMLGTKLDPNDKTIDWHEECNKLADKIMENKNE